MELILVGVGRGCHGSFLAVGSVNSHRNQSIQQISSKSFAGYSLAATRCLVLNISSQGEALSWIVDSGWGPVHSF
jgi:hypothetical protein